MIYLLRTIRPGRVFWKIGYAADVNKRFLQYEYHCPGIELVSTKPGERLEESLYHKYFHSFPQFFIGYYKDEWYITSDILGSFIQKAFEDVPVENMKDVVWENRDKVLSKYSQGDKEIWDSLRKNYESLTSSDIDRRMSKVKEDSPTDLMLKDDSEEIREFADLFKKERHFDLKLRLYCEFRENHKNNQEVSTKVAEYLKGFPFETYYSYFGIKGCRAQGFRFDRLSKMLNDKINKDSLTAVIYQSFALKETYSVKDIKNILKAIYDSLGINKTPKATDLLEYYNVLERKMTDSVTKKRIASYQFISIK
jgi:hypothetical protein